MTAVLTASTHVPTVGLLLVPLASSIPLALSLGRRRRPWWHWVGGAGALGLGGCLWSWGQLWQAVYGGGKNNNNNDDASSSSYCQPTADAATAAATWCHGLDTKTACLSTRVDDTTCEWNETAAEEAMATIATMVAIHLLLLMASAIPLTLSAFGKRRLLQKYPQQQQPRYYAAGWMAVFQFFTAAAAWSWSSTPVATEWPVVLTAAPLPIVLVCWLVCQAVYCWGMEHLVPHRTMRLVALMGVVLLAPIALAVVDHTATTTTTSDGGVLGWWLILTGLFIHRRAQTKGEEPTAAFPTLLVDGPPPQPDAAADQCLDDDDDDDESSVGSWGDIFFLGSFGPVEHQTSYALVREEPLLQTGDV